MYNTEYTEHYKSFHPDDIDHLNGMVKYLSDLLKDYIPQNKNSRILDIGCGFGYALSAVKSLGYEKTIGLEISETQAERAKKLGHNVQISSNTSEWLNSKRNQFDCILLMDVLEHIPVDDQINFIKSVQQSLATNGVLIITVPNALSPVASAMRYIDFTHVIAYTSQSLTFLLRASGFSSVYIVPSRQLGKIPKRIWSKKGRNAIRQWLTRWWWLQVIKTEFPEEKINSINIDQNILCVARR